MSRALVPRKNMRAEMYFTDRWVDVTAAKDVREKPITITRGASSQDRVVPPAQCTAVLDNRNARYSRRDPLSANYGALTTNTPLRVLVGITKDSFARTVAGGWGTSEHDDTWSLFQASGLVSNFSVAGGIASHLVTGTSTHRLTYLPEQLHRSVRVSVEYSLNFSNVTVADLEPANLVLCGVSTSNYIMVRVVITPAEVVTLQIRNVDGTLYGTGAVTVPGITHTADTWYKVVAEVEGHTVRAKLWAVDDTVEGSDGEPLDWTIDVAVVGSRGWVGVRSGVAAGNTNIPVDFRYRNWRVDSPRFIGEMSSLSPKWALADRDRLADVTSSGIMRRLSQGAPVLKSTLRRGIPTLTTLLQYWPMEDGENSSEFASAIDGAPAMTFSGDITLAAYDGFESSEPIPEMGSAIVTGTVPTYADTGEVQTRWIMHATETPLPDGTLIHRVRCSGGTIAFWDISAGAGGGLKITANTGAAEVLNSTIGFDVWGRNLRVGLALTQDGANIDYEISTYEVGAGFALVGGATLAGHTLGTASSVSFSLLGDLDGTAIGHATVENEAGDIFVLGPQLNAHNGETATARLGRLCFEEGVRATITGEYDNDALMGPQRPDTLLSLLKECADVDQGILHESTGVLGLRYRTRLSMINQPAAVTIDRSAGQLSPPFNPVDDDRLISNDVTVRRIKGSSFRAQKFDGPLSVAPPPSGAGRYDTGLDLNAYWDIQLPHLAGWLLSLGTVDEYRIPSVSADMAAPETAKARQLIYDLLSLEVGDLIVLTGLSSIGIYDDVRQIARGYSETLISHQHKLNVNTFPASPYDALVLDSSDLGRMDSESSTVDADFSATATSFDVATAETEDLWTTDGAEFPLDIMIAGERITLSGISGASSPQTFTASARAVNGVEKAHTAGSEVHIFDVVHLA
jgi:hypothetical protein